MEFQLRTAVQVLERTPRTVTAIVQDLVPAWTRATEGDATWSAVDVLGPLVHVEEGDWIPRARILLEHGEATAIEPIDRFALFARVMRKR